MILEQALYVAAILALLAVAYLAVKAVSLIAKLKGSLEAVDENLKEIKSLLAQVSQNLEPVLSSSQKTMEELAQTNQRLQRLLEEATALPPAIRELLLTFKDIFKELSEDLGQTLAKVNDLLQEGTNRLSTEVPAILQEIDGLLKRINAIVEDVQQKIAKTEELFKAVEETGRATRTVAEIISKNLTETVIEVAAVAKGIETSLKVLKNRLLPGGESHA